MPKNTTTIEEIRFLFHAAKAGQELLDNAVAQVLTETIEDLDNLDIKHAANLYIPHHGGLFDALMETIVFNVYGVFPVNKHDQQILVALGAKVRSVAELYTGLQVAVPRN